MRPALALLLLAACACTRPPPPPHVAVTPFRPEPVTPTGALAGPMAKVAFMRGVWSGPAKGVGIDGKPYEVTQTERMGPLLGGDIVVIEGRGYRPDGSTGFNAFGVVSYDPGADQYEFRAYGQGHAGTFVLKLTGTGYTWEVPAGPGAITRFTATITATTWREVGELIREGQPPVQIFEMNLVKRGDSDWPLGEPIDPKPPGMRKTVVEPLM